MDIKQITKKIIDFRDEREWKEFHTPENLAKSIMIEAAELLENYQWTNDKKQWENNVNVQEELADVMIYALTMCETLRLDPLKIMDDKIEKNKMKYKTGNEKIKNED